MSDERKVDGLTARQLEALRRFAMGETQVQVAERLGVTHSAVNKLSQRIVSTLGASNMTHAAVIACRAGAL